LTYCAGLKQFKRAKKILIIFRFFLENRFLGDFSLKKHHFGSACSGIKKGEKKHVFFIFFLEQGTKNRGKRQFLPFSPTLFLH